MIDSAITVGVTTPSVEFGVLRSVETAIFEAVENAHEDHDHEPGPPTIELSAEVEYDAKPPQVTLVIADDGPGIPERETVPLETGGETALYHTSGVGLWLMKWAVESEGGKFTIRENNPRGSAIVITLPCTVTDDRGDQF